MLPDPLQVSTPSLKISWNRPCVLHFSFTKYENLFGHWPVSVSKLQHKKSLIVGIEWVRWTFCDNVTRYFSFLSQHNAGLAFLLLIHALSFYTLSNSSTVMYPSLSDPRKFCLLTFPLTFDWTVPPGHPIVGETASIRSSRCWALNKFLPWRLIRNWFLDHYVTVVGNQVGKWTRWPAYLLPWLPLDLK